MCSLLPTTFPYPQLPFVQWEELLCALTILTIGDGHNLFKNAQEHLNRTLGYKTSAKGPEPPMHVSFATRPESHQCCP